MNYLNTNCFIVHLKNLNKQNTGVIIKCHNCTFYCIINKNYLPRYCQFKSLKALDVLMFRKCSWSIFHVHNEFQYDSFHRLPYNNILGLDFQAYIYPHVHTFQLPCNSNNSCHKALKDLIKIPQIIDLVVIIFTLFILIYFNATNLPISQYCPMNLGGQMHIFPDLFSVHFPPFKQHGPSLQLSWHSSSSVIIICRESFSTMNFRG